MPRLDETHSLFSSKSQTREEGGEKMGTVIWMVTALRPKCYGRFPRVLLKEAVLSRMSRDIEGHGIFKDVPGAQCAFQGLRGPKATD